MTTLMIISPGQCASVQDLGRHWHGSVGVASSGAADTMSLRLGNRLLGNPADAAALEMTYVGATVRADGPWRAVLTGAPARDARTTPGDTNAPMWTPFELAAGDELHIGTLSSGARTYLCIAGGIATAPTLGSRSLHTPTGLGSPTGAPCAAGDQLPLGHANTSNDRTPHTPAILPLIHELNRRTIRITPGPHGTDAISRQLCAQEWQVSARSDRMGARLEGSSIDVPSDASMRTEGAFPGAIQLPPSGLPIVLGPDCAPTGGYPIITSVISIDMPALAQRRPGDTIRFAAMSIEAAQNLAKERAAQIDGAIPPIA